MKKTMNKKAAASVSVIRGTDGPTSIFLIGKKDSKRTLRQNMQRKLFALRKRHIAKSLKAEPHTMDQVIEYAKSKWGYADISKNSEEYKTEYIQMRTSFILQHKPELLGEFKDFPQLEGQDESDIEHFMAMMNQRQKAAEEIPTEQFDIDLCILEMTKRAFESKLVFEKNYGYIGGSASGESKKPMKRYDRIFRDVYRYYGVSQADIDNQTKRYKEVLGMLARK